VISYLGSVFLETPFAVPAQKGQSANMQRQPIIRRPKVCYSKEFVRREVLIDPEHTEELRKFLGTIGADEAAVAVLKHAP
jgi:hypothetical protein